MKIVVWIRPISISLDADESHKTYEMINAVMKRFVSVCIFMSDFHLPMKKMVAGKMYCDNSP